MFRIFLNVDFIFIFYIVIHINYGSSEENITTTFETIPNESEKCAIVKCSCTDLQKLGEVVCEGNNSNYITSLTFHDKKHLPARMFFGFDIGRLIINNTDFTVDENIFEGMIGLRSFEVQQSSIQTIPNFRLVKYSIELIQIVSSPITSLEGENLQHLTLVSHIRFNMNSISFIDADIFKGTENIRVLDLSYNLLTFIPSNLLITMKSISEFNVRHNNLLHVDNVFSITIPSRISLEFNNITNTSSVLRFHERKYKQLIVREFGNRSNVELLPCRSFKKPKTFLNIYKETLLDLSDNAIEEASQPLFPCYWVENEQYSFTVQNLRLNGNNLQCLGELLKHSKINELSACRNQIQYLTEKDFSSVSDTFSIVLQENQIRRIDRNTFKPIRMYLRKLDLSFNSITALNGSVKYLFILQRLILSHNSIEVLAEDEFCGLDILYQLQLENNKIKSLAPLQEIPYLEDLNVINNDIPLIRVNEISNSLRQISLKDNSFQCNCRLQPFVLWLKDLQADSHLCSNPYPGISLPKRTSCPDMCSCRCIDTVDISFILTDCSSKNLSALPNFWRNNSPHTNDNEGITSYNFILMEQTTHPFFHIEDRVLGINMENNSLESLDETHLPPNLIYLYLSNNKLRSLPDSIFEKQLNLKEVTLSENPWHCDCNAMNFKKWLTSKSQIILDINNTRCGTSGNEESDLSGRVIWTLSDLDLCKPADITLIVSLVFGVISLFTIFLAGIIFYMKYNFNIKVFLYSHGFTFVKEEDLDHDKEFDAFISFSHKDDDFAVNEIISEIENKDPTIRLCIHYRHFKAGEFIYDNIIRAVQSSKRTLLILTRNFQDSEWCLVEFRTAIMQALEDKVHRVIVIKNGDMPKEMDPAIKAYLNSTTYLTWGEKQFWKKLFYVLPSGCSIGKAVPRCIENTDFALNFGLCDDEKMQKIYTNL